MTDIITQEEKSNIKELINQHFDLTGLNYDDEASKMALAKAMIGRELGLSPITAINGIHIVQNKPTLSAEAMRSLVFKSDPANRINLTFEGTGEKLVCHISAFRSSSGSTYEDSYSLAEAKSAGIAGKDTWKKHPKSMLVARATSNACRAIFADLIGGIYTPEEVREFEPAVVKASIHPTIDGEADGSIGTSIEDIMKAKRKRKAVAKKAPEPAEEPKKIVAEVEEKPTPKKSVAPPTRPAPATKPAPAKKLEEVDFEN